MSDGNSLEDPFTALVLKDSFEAICAEMSRVVERTAVHPLFSEVHDYSTGILYVDPKGELSLIARATALPVHIFSAVVSVQSLLDRFKGDMHPGDMYAINDPYLGGGAHHGDWTLMTPIFFGEGEIIIPSVRAHMADTAGVAAGGFHFDNRDAWQEGLRVPALRVAEKGELLTDVWAWILANTRIPETLWGDFQAMIGAIKVGQQRVQELLGKYGPVAMTRSLDYTLDYSSRRFSAEVSRWPDGVYAGEYFLDHDCAGTRDIRVAATVTVNGDRLSIDLSGCDPQVPGITNSPYGTTASWVYMAILTVIPEDIPINSAIFRQVEIYAPTGTVANPLPPKSQNYCTVMPSGEICTAVMKAFEQFIPERVGAVGLNYNLCSSFGRDSRYDDEFYFVVEYGNTAVAASGAKGADGWGGWTVSMATMIYAPIEMMEIQFPFRYHRYEYETDALGHGQFRGVPAFGMCREMVGQHAGCVNIAVQGARHPAPGWAGGLPGAASWAKLIDARGSEEIIEDVLPVRFVQPGELIVTRKGGGGGWGLPLRRDPRLVLDDVLDEIISLETARDVYGVFVDEGTRRVDEVRTRDLRSKMSSEILEAQQFGNTRTPVVVSGYRSSTK